MIMAYLTIWCCITMKAEIYLRDRIVISEDIMCEIVIWRLPNPTAERPHGLKYRLQCWTRAGTCIVRYDNEHGKGDHCHYGAGEKEKPYTFTTIEQLIADFFEDVNKAKGGLI